MRSITSADFTADSVVRTGAPGWRSRDVRCRRAPRLGTDRARAHERRLVAALVLLAAAAPAVVVRDAACVEVMSPAAVDPLLQVRAFGADRGVEAVAREHAAGRRGG